jgi:hypothetical protein
LKTQTNEQTNSEAEMDDDSHASSNHFCFSSGEIGNLTRECILDRLQVMLHNERTLYRYNHFSLMNSSEHQRNPMRVVPPEWRASICKWSYNVCDYFDLSREITSIAMSLFDRFFATKGSSAIKSNIVLLVSIATLHIAIKVSVSIEIECISPEQQYVQQLFS